MFHHERIWHVVELPSIQALAYRLKRPTPIWQGFYVAGHPDYLFLNDSTGNWDGFTEYAVVKGGLGATRRTQIESLTLDRCTHSKLLGYIRAALRGDWDDNRLSIELGTETIIGVPPAHG